MNPVEYSEVKLSGCNDNIDCQIDKTWNHLRDKSLFLLEKNVSVLSLLLGLRYRCHLIKEEVS